MLFAEEDYLADLHWLGEALSKEHCVLRVYVLMSNHAHLLIIPGQAGAVPRLVIALGRRYVQYINRYRRTGTLWGGRYKSPVIQAETYLLRCQLFIELNPVRAGMVDEPAHYRWSRHGHNALGQANRCVICHPLYRALGKDEKTRQGAYRHVLRGALDQEVISDIRLALNQNELLGNFRFYAKIEAQTGRPQEAKPRGRPREQQDQLSAPDAGQRGLPV